LEANPSDRRTRLLLAGGVANLGRLEEAVATLRQGMALDPEGPYGPAIAKIYITAYDRLKFNDPPDYRAQLSAIREALRFDAKSVEAAVRLAEFGEPAGRAGQALGTTPDEKTQREVRDLLEGLLASGEQPPAVHMALGLKAWRSDDLERARWHFERAYELDS